jgi:hypothetical protein
VTGLVGPEPISADTQAALDAKVTKPTSTDNAAVRFDGTAGAVQDSAVTISDTGVITAPVNGCTFGDGAVAAAAAGAAYRAFNLASSSAVVRIWRTNNDPGLEFLGGSSFVADASASLWWDIFGDWDGDLLAIRRRTGGVLQQKLTISADGTITVQANAPLVGARVRPRVGTTTSSATPAINSDNVDVFTITALAVNITSFTMSGTPTDGQQLWIAITGTAARTIAWGTSFEASTVALPTGTTSTNRLDCEFIWNAATSRWRIVRAV